MKTIMILFLVLTSLASADTITIKADNWCPYNCDPAGTEKGYIIEILEEVFGKKSHKIDYQLLPWTDALKAAVDGKISGVVGAGTGELEGGVYSEPMGSSLNCIYTTRKSTLNYTKPEDLKNLKVGVIKDYSYAPEINEYIAKNKSQFKEESGNAPLKMNIKKLIAGEIDAIIENENVFSYTASRLSATVLLRSAGCTAKEFIYVAFSGKGKSSQQYAKDLNEGLAELRKNGKLNDILKKYELKDWK